MTHPPTTSGGRSGLHALKALGPGFDILAALRAFHHELGDVFQIRVPGFRPYVMAGPEAARSVYLSDRRRLLWRQDSDAVAQLLGRGVLVVDGEEHAYLRGLMEPFLQRRRLGQHVPVMVHYTDQVTRTWPRQETELDMLVEMRRIALLILVRTLFAVDMTPDVERLWQPVLASIAYISPGAWLWWPDLPRPSYRRNLQQLDAYLYQIIAARRQAMQQAGSGPADVDLLGRLLSEPGLSDQVIRDQMLTMLIAGHDTSTALLAWALYLLGQHPAALATARAEVDRVLEGQPPDFERAGELRYLEQVLKETLRLYPPIHVSNRLLGQEMQFDGYDLPAGARLLFSIYLTHRHPQHWPQPDAFQPERFAPGEQGRRPAFSYVPFGGGPRNCIGAAYGLLEATVVLARLLQRFDFDLAPRPVHEHMGATLEPRPGVFMRMRRRESRP